MLLLMKRKITPDRMEINRRQYSKEKIQKKTHKKYIGFEEPLLFHAGKVARPQWSTHWVNYSPWLPQLQPYMDTGENSQ